ASAKDSAEKVLLVKRGKHQGRRNRRRIVQNIHFVGLEHRVCVGSCPGADGYYQNFVLARGPIEIKWLHGSHNERLKRGIIVHGYTAVDKNKLLLSDFHYFRRKVGRRGSTCTN